MARHLADRRGSVAGWVLLAGACCCNLYEGRFPNLFSDAVESPPECRTASDCPSERARCADAACVECIADSDCDLTRPLCVENTCVEHTESAEPAQPGCDASDTCEPSVPDAARPDAAYTDAQPPACSAEAQCAECASDDHCTDPKSPACNAATQSCAECTRDEHCGRGKRCDVTASRCVREPPPPPLTPDPADAIDSGIATDAAAPPASGPHRQP